MLCFIGRWQRLSRVHLRSSWIISIRNNQKQGLCCCSWPLCRHPFSRVLAKNVYNEYIADRHHIHMNATRWLTLTEFVKYLGREGEFSVALCMRGACV